MTLRTRHLAHRFTAVLLLAVAALRGGIPALDAVTRHGGDAPERLGIHLDQPGGCSSHAEHCVLRAADSGLRFTPPDTVRSAPAVHIVRHGRVARDLATGRQASSSNLSRAPPVTLV